ncbi:hypothetical protein CH063_14584 [Colletotrichum higginsianum]|uniref:Uncharacterized protein n=1 Tax=Colletotrichum higginsianum (strain IMI 349063) TaxID=759273 RepID=H1VZ69_COLHI|nr:uncharacterized protein CH63R_10095 [Colletotrichum higginsianum IMI 349063]OBR05975.1 hypothetical protein CH63R_10095 [Colletotrichum higginsianum IMI 349063]CCF45531.1 hypothetical protein CH063_14584 [Colletotrichum higginsianum]
MRATRATQSPANWGNVCTSCMASTAKEYLVLVAYDEREGKTRKTRTRHLSRLPLITFTGRTAPSASPVIRQINNKNAQPGRGRERERYLIFRYREPCYRQHNSNART